jgi:hypothetical protein
MANFRDKLLALIDNTANQAKEMIGGFNTMVDEIDWDAHFNTATEFMREQKESLTAKANELLKEFSELVKQVKDNLTDFAVTVAFDESIGEKLEYTAENGVLKIEVSYKDDITTRSNKTEVKIPENCDVAHITKTVNATAKTATITIPKVLIEPNEEKKDNQPKEHTYKVRKGNKKTKTTVVAEEKTDEQTSKHVSSKLAEKLQQNVEKARVRRDASGRFIRRNAPTA